MTQRIARIFLNLALVALAASDCVGGTADNLIAAALERNPEIKSAQAEWKAAHARIPQVRSLPDPTASVESMGIGNVGSENTALLNQAFPWPGTLGQRENVASMQARSTWHQVEAVKLRLTGRIQVLAYEIAYLATEAKILREILQLYEKQEAFLEEVSRGGGEITDLLRIEMESGLLSDESARLGEEIQRQSLELESLVARPITENEVRSLTLPAKIPAQPSVELIGQLVGRNPSLQALSARTEAARAGVALARLETFPELMLGAGYRNVVEPGMSGGREVMNEGVVMVSVSLPIWGDKNRGARDEAAAMLEVAQREYENLQRLLESQVSIFRSRHRDAARRAALFENTLIPKARQNHESIESSYRAGQSSLLNLLEARKKLLETQTGYWRAVTDLHINQANLDSLFGTEIDMSKHSANHQTP